jgi:hypothetical protein
MSKKEPGRRALLRYYLPIWAFISIAAITGLWILFYIRYSTDGLPLGWDTPYYIWRIHSAAASGTVSFVFGLRYYNFLYPTIGSWITVAGLDAFWVEAIVPLSLWIVGTLIIVAIVREEMHDTKASLIALGAGSTWFGFLRLSSDLHANLLGLVLMLCGTWLFLQTQAEVRPRLLAAKTSGLGGIILLSTFAHVETAIFISATLVLALILSLWRSLVSFRKFVTILATICLSLLPGAVIFWFQQQWIASPLQGRLPAIPTMPLVTWLVYLGPIGFAVLVAGGMVFLPKLMRISSPIIALTFSWLLLSLAIGFAQYLNQSITPFSERAIILMPTPFLAAITIPRLGALKKLTSQLKGIAMISMIMIGGSTLYYASTGHQFYNSFISDSASASLHYLQSSGAIDVRKSIFIVSDPPGQPGIGEHDSFWVGAFLGDHYTYLGRLDFLMTGLETPFADDQSAQVSRIFFEGLPINQVPNMTIVYIEDFNSPAPLPNFFLTFLQPLGKNVYEVNRAAWNPNLVIIPAYSSVLSSSGGWYWSARTWTRSGSSLELNSTRPTQVATASVDFAVPQDATYNVTLRIWDGAPSNPISVMLDGKTTTQLTYHGTFTAVNATVFKGTLSKGVHTLTLAVDNQPSLPQYVSLDYISIKQ